MRQKIFPHELIGKEIVVINATNPSLLDLGGKVVDETKNTLVIEYKGEQKTLMKSQVDIKVKETDKIIEGKELARRPEDRLKG